jgi:methylmalonyl-CoA mutase C-terminal domain/subunit
MELLRVKGGENIMVFAGGIIPREDAEELKRMGVAEIFGPGTPLAEIVDFLEGRFH